MNKICTTIEQSNKLIELRIDVNTADMFWDTLFAKKPEVQVDNHHFVDEWDDEHRIPAWSLSALLGLMPNVNGHYPELCRGKHTGQYYMWIEDTFDTQTFNNSIDAAFEMIVWLKENGKL